MNKINGEKAPWNPRDYLLAIVDSRQNAQKIIEALKKSGFHGQDVQLWTNKEAADRLNPDCPECGIVDKAVKWVWSMGTQEAYNLKDFQYEAAKANKHVIVVHATENADVEKAEDILEFHGAHHIDYFKHDGTVTGIKP